MVFSYTHLLFSISLTREARESSNEAYGCRSLTRNKNKLDNGTFTTKCTNYTLLFFYSLPYSPAWSMKQIVSFFEFDICLANKYNNIYFLYDLFGDEFPYS